MVLMGLIPGLEAAVMETVTSPVEVPVDLSLERIRRAVAVLGLPGMFYPRRPAMAAGPVFEVEALLRRSPGLFALADFAEVCRRAGMREAAMFLEDSAAWERVDRLAGSTLHCLDGSGFDGLSFVVASDGSFPAALRGRVPVLWCREHPDSARELALLDRSIPVSVVGSRSPGTVSARFAAGLSGALARAGCALVSGGAPGIDRISAAAYVRAGGGDLTEFWPCGLLLPWSEVFVRADDWFGPKAERKRRIRALSAAAPHEPFSAGRAMERNGFIYATGAATVVIQARLRGGGTWHGAVSALRRGERVMVFMGEERCEEREVKEDGSRGSENVEDSWREAETRLRKSEAVEDEEERLMETEMGARENCQWRAAQALCALGAVPVRSVSDVLAHLNDFESTFRRSRNASLFDDAGSEAPPKTNKKRPKVA
jgi:predicted Rossmann fold nucleotide-binding protein DprA/Smf involved in DNA uptake